MKVIASDFDNTFYVKNTEILLKNIDAVRNFINKGNIFIIITGRSYTNISKVIKKYKIPYSFLVCQDGASIFDKNECIKSNLLSIEKSKLIQEYLEKNNIEYSFESSLNDNDLINNAVKITVTINKGNNPHKILKDIKEIVDIYAYVSSKHINIIDINVNKSNALKYMQNKKIINKNLTVIGDDINDLEMLTTYNGVVMKKHEPILDSLNKAEIESVHDYLNKIV